MDESKCITGKKTKLGHSDILQDFPDNFTYEKHS